MKIVLLFELLLAIMAAPVDWGLVYFWSHDCRKFPAMWAYLQCGPLKDRRRISGNTEYVYRVFECVVH